MLSDQWKKNSHNFVLKREGFFLSYNPNLRSDPFVAAIDSAFGEVTEDETAIVDETISPKRFYVLKGDHRKELQDLSLTEARLYFANNEELWGWSTNRLPE